MNTTISSLHLSSDKDNQFAFVRDECQQTCTDTIMTPSENSADISLSPSKTLPMKPQQYRIRRGRPKLATRASKICVHGITRSVCKVCDPVGYKISRIRACVAGGLKRVSVVKCKKTLQYLGVPSFDTVIQHFQRKMDIYNTKHPQSLQMTFDNIHIDHIKPAKAFGDEINHYTNLQPLLPAVNHSKKARWSAIDELYWCENIKNNTDYADIYLSSCEHVDTTQENYSAQTKPKAHISTPKTTKEELAKELRLWKEDIPTEKSEHFDAIIYKLRGITNTLFPSENLDPNEIAAIGKAKTRIKKHIETFQDLGQSESVDRVNNIFLHDATFKSNQNMVLGMYTLEKIKRMKAHAVTLDYALPNAKTGPVCICLLHELIEVFNTDLQKSSRIKVSDLSLRQKQYNEGEKIEITDEMWKLFSFNCRAIKKRPETRRGLMTVIFTLAQKIFGKWFTNKKETTHRFTDSENVKKTTKCYNYVGNPMFLAVYVRLTDWSKHDLSDFEPAMVSKFKLEIRQRRDVGIDKLIREAHDPVKIKEKEKLDLLEDKVKQLREDEVKQKRALLSIEPPPKRRKTSKTDALSQKEQDEQQCITQDVQKSQLIDTELIKKRERLVTKKKEIKESTASRRIILSNKDRNPKRFKTTSLPQCDPPPERSILSETAALSHKVQI